jgi:hypothetical protein
MDRGISMAAGIKILQKSVFFDFSDPGMLRLRIGALIDGSFEHRKDGFGPLN